MATRSGDSTSSDLQERRYLTILFCDLVGFTELSEQLDPEELRDVLSRYQHLTVTVMEGYGGFVATFSGDGISVYFGYPVAHENDAERAVRAGLELIERLRDINVQARHRPVRPLAARIGVHTGLAVIGPEQASAGQSVQSAVGEPVNLAARLQAEAPPNSVVVSEATLELLGGSFDTEPLGARKIRGISRMILVHRISRARPASSHMRGRRRGASRMVGRTGDLERVLWRWMNVRQNSRCQTVLVEGEAGIGKTRLVVEFCKRPELADATVLPMACHEIFASTPLYPIGTLLWARIGPAADGDRTADIQNLSKFLDEVGVNSAENLEIAASLLGLTQTSKLDEIAPTPMLVRRRQFAFLISLVQQMTRRQPTVLWIDDAHWLDPSSAELVRDVVAHLADAPFLVLLTLRSFPEGPALPRANEVIYLEPLDAEDCLELARSIPGAQALSDQALSHAVEAADGIPLFAEQLVLSLVDQDADALDLDRTSRLPLTLAELLSERLDRLPGGRRIVQAAACLGRSFTAGFLASLLQSTDEQIVEPLEALVGAEILRPWPDGVETRYEFRHALLQRMAYESMVQAERRIMHGRIVTALNERASGVPAIPELMAHHLTAAGQFHDAIRMWLHAGVSAARRSAHIEAIQHLRRGLTLLGEISQPQVHRELEMNLQAALIGSITATQGSTSSMLSECCQRGMQLCREGEPTPLVFPFLFGQFTFTICRGHTREAADLAKAFLSLADRNSYDVGRVIGHRLVGMSLLAQGDAAKAREQLERSLQLYSRERDANATHLFGQDAEVHGRSLLSLAQFCLGEVDEALRVGCQALQTADALRHPHSTAIALAYVGGWVLGLCGAPDELMREARRLIEVSEQHRLGAFRAFGAAFFGWALCQKGDLEEGIVALEQAIETFDAVDYRLSLAGHLGNLADAKRRSGQLGDAEALCARAFQIMSAGADRWLEPEVRRIHALIVDNLRPQDSDKAEALYRGAVECARNFGFPVFELRCLLTLQEFLKPLRHDVEVESRIRELSAFGDLDRRAAEALLTYESCA
jgi:class 3 adenylate cyclase/tetratricopeptide (TPR) repeat protein